MSRSATAPTNCGECELPLRWEQIDDGSGERWLAVCACGMPWVFFPGRPGYRPRDPLRAALLAEAAPAGPAPPPWIRLSSSARATRGGSPGATSRAPARGAPSA